MGIRSRLVPLFGALGMLAVACSSGGDGGSGSGDFAVRYCALFKPCCEAAGLPTTQEGCLLLFSVGAPADQAAADACIAEYEGWAQEADWCTTLGANRPRPESCERAYPQGSGGSGGSGGGGGNENTGTAELGEDCGFPSDCAPNSRGRVGCAHDFDTNSRYCQLQVKVGEGEDCYGNVDGNSTSTTNVPSGSTEIGLCDRAAGVSCEGGTCVPLSDVGEPCATSERCASDENYCSGTCTPKVPPGSSCADSSAACDSSGYCDFASQACIERMPNGAACSSNRECVSSYCYETCGDRPGGLQLLTFCL